MNIRQSMTLSICTRNRHEDLTRCIRSIAAQSPSFAVEVLIVDDGELPDGMLGEFAETLNSGGGSHFELSYHKKRNPGLLHSRIESAKKAKYPILLFLDDDVELGEGYLERLRLMYERYPKATAIGGRDVLLGTSFIWRAFCRVFLYGARKPGKLSLSGYGGSMIKWVSEKAPFRTDYLAGCNMSFRRSALLDLRPVPWLLGYSVGEDLYLTYHASLKGEAWLDPDLTVVHRQSLSSRDKVQFVAYTDIVNHYYLLREKGSPGWRYACLFWTSCGLLLRSILKPSHRVKISGYAKGMAFLFKRKARENKVLPIAVSRLSGEEAEV